MESRENEIDQLIKRQLKDKARNMDGLSFYQNCPSELELSDYLENRLSRQKENLLLEHIADCPHCLSLLELAKRKKEEVKGKAVTSEMLIRAKNTMQKRPKKTIFDYKWPIFAFISFILSFIITRYFLQFLILAVIFSLKWIFDTASTRTLIMIYEAWRKKDKNTAQKIIQDFQDKDKIEQRR